MKRPSFFLFFCSLVIFPPLTFLLLLTLILYSLNLIKMAIIDHYSLYYSMCVLPGPTSAARWSSLRRARP